MVIANDSTYEETRQKRLEENKKRMEELKNLAQSLHKPNSSPMKKVKPKVPKLSLDPSSIRRSSRAVEKPVSYKSVAVFSVEGVETSKRKSFNRRKLANRVYASNKDRAYATRRAEKLQSSLDKGFPSFVKPMLQSHVTGGFWLGLPHKFCKANLPTSDSEFTMNLVDEEGNESPTKYLPLKCGLSGGWRGFSLEHKLVDGDALVFQLINPTTFKVYIVRVNQP